LLSEINDFNENLIQSSDRASNPGGQSKSGGGVNNLHCNEWRHICHQEDESLHLVKRSGVIDEDMVD